MLYKTQVHAEGNGVGFLALGGIARSVSIAWIRIKHFLCVGDEYGVLDSSLRKQSETKQVHTTNFCGTCTFPAMDKSKTLRYPRRA